MIDYLIDEIDKIKRLYIYGGIKAIRKNNLPTEFDYMRIEWGAAFFVKPILTVKLNLIEDSVKIVYSVCDIDDYNKKISIPYCDPICDITAKEFLQFEEETVEKMAMYFFRNIENGMIPVKLQH